MENMEIKKTTDYFNMSVNDLLEIRNNEGYTREECKLFDSGEHVTFFDDIQE